jgi:hypothetical protein
MEAAQQVEHGRKGGEVHIVAGMLRPAQDDGRVIALRRLRQRVAIVRQDRRQPRAGGDQMVTDQGDRRLRIVLNDQDVHDPHPLDGAHDV